MLRFDGKFKKVLPVLLGNTLEAYDFCLYGLLAIYFSKVFFPQSKYSLTLAFLLFSVAYLARPLGSIIWGHIADKYGRKTVLISTLSLMAIPAIGMACMPSYENIGIIASILVIFFRFLQGIAFGGEIPTIIVILCELAPTNRKGFFGSFTPCFFLIGYLIAMLAIVLLTNILSSEQMLSWGWRIPLGLSVIFVFAIFYIRFQLVETKPYSICKSISPVVDAFKNNLSSIIKISLYLLCETVLFYNVMFYHHTFLKTKGIFSDNAIFTLQLFCVFIVIVFLPLFGYLSDILGRRRISKYSFIFLILFTIPLYQLISSNFFTNVALAFIVLAFLLTVVLAVYSPIIFDEADMHCRVSVVGLGYSTITVIGSFTPMINQKLIYFYETNVAIAFYIVIAAVISLIVLHTLKDKQMVGNKDVTKPS